VDELPNGKYELKVDLIGGNHGEYSESYWFEFDVEDALHVRRISQQPMHRS
jgi:hypothetical protein